MAFGFALAAVFGGLGPRALSAQTTGREVALRWDAVDDSQSSSFRAVMTIRRGDSFLVRAMDVSRKKEPDSEKQLIAFLEPPDVRGVSYLTWASKDPLKEDDMWVFLPAESITRRIAGGARKGPFMRGDYALEDILRREVDEDVWELLGEEKLLGAECYVLLATPVDPKKGGYAKRRIWIRKDVNLPTKAEYYGANDKLIKTLTLGDFQNIQGIWIPLKQEMRASGTDSSTRLELTDVVFNEPMPSDRFLPQNLKR
ncbi:MAG: outer membrane lipoprotein-sorting protein [Deltaproteobacteria bacterium]|jgi:hypothetical protein|nr:outer membrane lipoprotein-sorting protein [Deltaproteobacteria bacterium]